MSDLDRVIRQHRAALAQRERASRAVMRRAYRQAHASLADDLRAVQRRIRELQASGEPVPTWRVLQETRIRQLLARTELAFQRYSEIVRADVISSQRAAITLAQHDAMRAIEAAYGPPPQGAMLPMALVPTAAIERAVSVLQPNAPVGRLLTEMAGKAAQAVADEITNGMAAGESPRVIAANISRRLGGQRARSFLIVRDQMLKAYRGAIGETLKANRHLLKGWRWNAALTDRTCPVCWAMHGRVFSVDEELNSHPGCRCSKSPVVKGWKELGYDVTATPVDTIRGPERFAALDATTQRAILGPLAYRSYRRGEIDLPDLVGITRSPIWGPGRRRIDIDTAKRRRKRAA